MDVKIGDKIRFLNDVGGGIVIDFQQDTNRAIVEQDDGFSFPIPISECVVIERMFEVQTIEKIQKPIISIKPKIKNDIIVKPYDMEKNIKKLQDYFSNSNTTYKSSTTLHRKRKIETVADVVEVDLHIDKLLDSTVGMSNSDMLEYQLSVVRQTIDAHEKYRGQKIIFIHGKGDGVLRCAIERELKRLGRHNNARCASFKRYGFGALMVVM